MKKHCQFAECHSCEKRPLTEARFVSSGSRLFQIAKDRVAGANMLRLFLAKVNEQIGVSISLDQDTTRISFPVLHSRQEMVGSKPLIYAISDQRLLSHAGTPAATFAILPQLRWLNLFPEKVLQIAMCHLLFASRCVEAGQIA